MSLLKHLPGLILGVAAAAAVYFVTRENKDEEYEHIVGPEDVVEVDDEAEDAEQTDPAQPEAEAAPAEPQAAPAAQTAAPVDDGKKRNAKADAPNANPVMQGKQDVPTTEDGKLDATKIADPVDFGDWDETGCQG